MGSPALEKALRRMESRPKAPWWEPGRVRRLTPTTARLSRSWQPPRCRPRPCARRPQSASRGHPQPPSAAGRCPQRYQPAPRPYLRCIPVDRKRADGGGWRRRTNCSGARGRDAMCGDGYGGRRVRHDARGAGQHAACESGSCRLRSSRWGWGVSHGQRGVMAISWDYQFPLSDPVHSSFYLGKTQICKPSRHAGLASSAHKSNLGTHKVSCPHDPSDARMVTGAHPTNRVGTYCAEAASA